MDDEKYIELINKEICGIITPTERRELNEYRRKRPGAEKLYREFLRTSELLNEVGDVEPPADLKKRIMDSLDFSRYRAKRGWWVFESLLRIRHLALKPRVAYAFATGVVVGLVVYSLFLTRPPGRYATDVGDLYGTIGIRKDASFTTIERLPISLAWVGGEVDLLQAADVLMFEVSLRGPRQWEVLVEYDSAQASFNGLRPDDHGKIILETGEGYVRASDSGEGEFGLSFIKDPATAASIELKLLISGELLWSHRFLIAPKDE